MMARTGFRIWRARARWMSLFALGWAGISWAQEQSVKPGINDEFKKPGFQAAQWKGRFETESREVFARRGRIVEQCAVKPGWTVADVGAGTGLFTLLFARAVGEHGRVIAVDIAEDFLTGIRDRARTEGHTNILTVLGTDRDPRLPTHGVDLVFLCDTYHHLEFPQETLAAIRGALKPTGTLVVVDFHRIPGRSSEWVLGHVRAGRDECVREIEAAGFELVPGDGPAFLEENYLVRFRSSAGVSP